VLASIWPHGALGLSRAPAEPLLGDAKSFPALRDARASTSILTQEGPNCDDSTRIEVEVCQIT
jgi:hypothetical protein